MKVIGLIGGMSWESSLEYYRIINQEMRARLGRSHSAKSIMWSMDFDEIKRLQHEDKWAELEEIMISAAQNLERGGADFIVICTNTMHKLADGISAKITLPIIHIADATAEKIKAAGFSKVGLLGTAFTMEQEFYKGRLASKFDMAVVVPDDEDRKTVHDIIYSELVCGQVKETSRDQYRAIIRRLVDRGAEAIILGCTEIMLLVSQEDSSVPIFDTTRLHALAAVDAALS